MKLQKLSIDETDFMDAFARDLQFHDPSSRSTYLNLKSGEIIWVYDDDEDGYLESGRPEEENKAIRSLVEAAPDQYLEIPGLDHGDHHEILKEFLDSDWTNNKEACINARSAYSGSIGRWIKSVGDDNIIEAYFKFRVWRAKQMAEEFLRGNGIDPVWI
jgi:hypothetical protein